MAHDEDTFIDQALRSLPRELLLNDAFAEELYGALCNVRWQRPDADDGVMFSFRTAAGIIAELRNELRDEPDATGGRRIRCACGRPLADHELGLLCPRGGSYTPVAPHESYIDFYCSGSEGEISERVRTLLAERGYQPQPLA